jgi:ABC-type transport system involved in cytochrome c biogenesis permease component
MFQATTYVLRLCGRLSSSIHCWVVSYCCGTGDVALTDIMQVVMIARLYAMYQRSRKMLIFLVVIFMVITIIFGVMGAIGSSHTSARKL